MPTVNSAGVEVYYEDYGSGIPVVFAHGAGGNAAIWFEQIAAFSDTYRCVAFDHRTFARSPADPASRLNRSAKLGPLRFRLCRGPYPIILTELADPTRLAATLRRNAPRLSGS